MATQATQAVGQADSVSVPKDWINLDPELDGVMGVGSDRAYDYLKGRTPRTIIVAIIDSGIDVEHEDLKDHIWVNEDEIVGNGIDDDSNGYIDDVHGWNFIGGENGDVLEDTHEMTREYVRLFSKYYETTTDSVDPTDSVEYKYWKKLKSDFESIYNKTVEEYNFYANLMLTVDYFDSLLRAEMDIEMITPDDLMDKDEDDSVTAIGKGILNFVFTATGGELTLEEIQRDLEQTEKHYRDQLEFTYNVNFDPRDVVGDDYSDIFQRYYGNNNVEGPDASHGTHVAGIVAADRDNELGIRGIAKNVRLMSVRAVPHGDERDKDVANAIRYAVDNGAHIINMSFGKSFTYGKLAVDSAIMYAMENGVLLVHASGNESKDRDVYKRYPVKELNNGIVADNWIEVGANAARVDEYFVGSFSNYGKNYVDFFAPGVDIQSTKPEDKYDEAQGTSMAAPAVSAVAAILMGYFPELNYKQVRDILRSSVVPVDVSVNVPGKEGVKKNFSELSITGGIVNAYKAVVEADLNSKKSR